MTPLSARDPAVLGADSQSAARVLGIVFRETGRPALAESRLRSAIDLFARVGAVNDARRTMVRLQELQVA